MQTKAAPKSALQRSLARLQAPDFFKALAEPNRLAILLELAANGRPAALSERGGGCARGHSVGSRHLGKLREAGILRAERRGKEIHYSLAVRLADTLRAIADALDACCPPGGGCCVGSGGKAKTKRSRS